MASPDGTNHAVYYGNNTNSPGEVLDTRAIPGTERAIATFSSFSTSNQPSSEIWNFIGRHRSPSHSSGGEPLDFAQALAQEGAWWLANTGYGYGMDDSIAYSERLFYLFIQKVQVGKVERLILVKQ